MPEGAHELVAKCKSWPEQRREIRGAGNAPTSAAFEFACGSVKITSAPAGATVLANGVEIGTTPLPLDEVEPGEVRDEVRLAGFKRFPVGHAVATSGGHGKFRRYAGKARRLSDRGLSRWFHADFAGG